MDEIVYSKGMHRIKGKRGERNELLIFSGFNVMMTIGTTIPLPQPYSDKSKAQPSITSAESKLHM